MTLIRISNQAKKSCHIMSPVICQGSRGTTCTVVVYLRQDKLWSPSFFRLVFNSELFFSLTGCHLKARDPSQCCYLTHSWMEGEKKGGICAKVNSSGYQTPLANISYQFANNYTICRFIQPKKTLCHMHEQTFSYRVTQSILGCYSKIEYCTIKIN